MSTDLPILPVVTKAWNIGPRPRGPRGWHSLRVDLKQIITRDSAIALFEAHRFRRQIREQWAVSHRVFVARDSIVLIPKSWPTPHVTIVGHDVVWFGPHMMRPKRGRQWVQLDWPDLRLLPIHMPSGGPSGGILTRGRNRAAWGSSMAMIGRASRGVDHFAAIGDANANPVELATDATRLSLTVTRGHGVDHCLSRGLKVTAGIGAKHGSDAHHVLTYRLTAKEHKP